MPSSHLILCRPLLLLPPIPPSIIVFSNESTLCMRWPKYWSFSFSIIHSKEIPGLISFRMDWLDLLAVQGTLKSLCQHHSSKASILQCSAFFTVLMVAKLGLASESCRDKKKFRYFKFYTPFSNTLIWWIRCTIQDSKFLTSSPGTSESYPGLKTTPLIQQTIGLKPPAICFCK